MRISVAVVALLALSGCALYTDVSVAPLHLNPADIERGSDMQSMQRKADYLRAMAMSPTVDARQKKTAPELHALGSVYLAAGRFDDARTRLRAALDLQPFRTTYGQIAWDLAQVEYMANNYESSLEWAKLAREHDLSIRQWHIDFMEALQGTRVYQFSGDKSARLPFRFGRPDVPRVTAAVNGQNIEAIIDSGAVLSIVSQRLAASANVRSLGAFEGTFYGLLGEPIQVRFGIIEKLDLGTLTVANVPVAIMPDEKMRFLISKREGREFHMDFLLGTNLLKEFRLELNFDHHRVTFKPLTAADRRPDAEQNLFFEGFRPYVRGTINRKGWYLFVLDTGSEITFLNETRLRALPVMSMLGAHSAMLQGLGGTMKRGSKIEDVEVGMDKWAGKFRMLPMYSSSEKEMAVGIIGQNFLRHFNVVIDFGRMRMDLERR
ncbi:MAG TPA: retroviral-like aspartic protease family protein [Thermoanaerobaculia bacterium]|nr:retroviral-like aspartic protease family protein [Thermoanaerobaculia bacterium]